MKLKQWSITLSVNITPGPVGFKRQVLPNFQKIFVPILLDSKKGGLFLSSNYKPNIMLIPKPDKSLWAYFTHKYRTKIPKKHKRKKLIQ